MKNENREKKIGLLASVLIFVALCLCGQARAATHVTGTYSLGVSPKVLATVNGNSVYGFIYAQRSAVVTWQSTQYNTSQKIAYLDASGNIFDAAASPNLWIDLVPNTTATPANSYYSVTFNIQGAVHNELWVVPETSSVAVEAVRVTQPPATSGSPFDLANATGLLAISKLGTPTPCTSLYFLRWSGSAWTCAAASGGGASTFDAMGSGTNTTAAMVVGSGASLDWTGTGYVNARKVNGVTFTNSESLGKIPIGQGDGTAVWADPLVQGLTAHDAAGSSTNPVAGGGFASAAAPTDVSADGDIVRSWFLRNGAGVFNLVHNGTLYDARARTWTLSSGTDSVAVTGTFWQATQPVSGTVTANAGSGNFATNIAQVGGNTLLTGNGVTGTGSPRVTVASDNTPFAVKTDQTTHGTTDLVAADLTKVAGSSVSTVATGVAKVGIADSAGTAFLSAANALNSTGGGVQAAQIVGQFDDVTPTSITENQFGNIRMSANRNIYTTLRDAAGNERGANINASNQLSVSVDNTAAFNLASVGGTSVSGANVVDTGNTAFRVNCVTGCTAGGSFTDNSVFTGGSTSVSNTGWLYDVTPPAITDGNAGIPRMNSSRVAMFDLAYYNGSAAGASNAVHVQPGTGAIFTVKTDQTTHGTTDLVSADLTKIGGNAILTGNGVTGTGSPRVTVASDNTPFAVKTDQTTHGTTDLVAADLTKVAGSSVSTVATGVAKVGIADSAGTAFLSAANALNSTGGGVQAAQIVGQFDDVTPTSITENQFGNIRMSANRNIYTTLRDAAGNERGANITASNALVVDGSAVTQPVSGTVTANAGSGNFATNIAQVGGNAVLTGNGVTGTGSPRVTVASDNTPFAVKTDQTTHGTTDLVAADVTKIAGSSVSTAASGVQKVGIVGNAGATVDSTVGAGTAPTNAIVDGAIYNTTAPAPTNGQAMAKQADEAGNLRTTPGIALKTLSNWSSGTSVNATQNIFTNSGVSSVLVQTDTTSTVSGGAITFEGTFDGTNWVTVAANQVLDPTSTSLAQISLPYTLVASTNKPFMILTQGMQGLRIKLSTAITGTATLTPYYALLGAPNTVQAVTYSPTAANMKVQTDASGATGTAPPSRGEFTSGIVSGATGGLLGGITVCDQWVAISQTSGTQLISGVSGRKTYICSINLVTATAQNVALVGGTGTVCATGTHAIAGGTTAATGWNFAANGGLAQGSGLGVIMQASTAADNVCLLQSGSGQISGAISYAIY